ncbi:MAG: type II secretion system F family protein [Actinomycetota bacterium]
MSPQQRADALRTLAGLLRCGRTLREALTEWPHAVAEAADELSPTARRARLGLPIPAILEALHDSFQDDARALAGCFRLCPRGADGAALADRLANAIEQREAALASSRVAASGGRLSARLVAGLPLGFVPLAASSGSPMFDRQGILLLALGLGLLGTGLAWLNRLIPRGLEGENEAAQLAAVSVDLLSAGLPLRSSLAIGAELVGGEDLKRATRLTRLGFGWPQALEAAGDRDLSRLAFLLRNSGRAGTPIASALSEFVRWARAERSREFDRVRRRAPILMVLPLTLCVLPAFVLLGIVPFLRSLALST